ncbi:hypothetical protein MTO96_010329 [Rhipicephalus appendiculatus]
MTAIASIIVLSSEVSTQGTSVSQHWAISPSDKWHYCPEDVRNNNWKVRENGHVEFLQHFYAFGREKEDLLDDGCEARLGAYLSEFFTICIA